VSGEQRLDTRSDPLQLETLDLMADHDMRPAREGPHTDRLLAGGRRDDQLALALQSCQIGTRGAQQGDLVPARSLPGPALAVESRDRVFSDVAAATPGQASVTCRVKM
jgi:hypothetical protein